MENEATKAEVYRPKAEADELPYSTMTMKRRRQSIMKPLTGTEYIRISRTGRLIIKSEKEIQQMAASGRLVKVKKGVYEQSGKQTKS